MKSGSGIGIKRNVLGGEQSLLVKQKEKKRCILYMLFMLPVVAFILSLVLGRYGIPISQLFDIFAGKLFNLPVTWPETQETVLFQVRIPRIVAAMLVGAALSAAGATYQGLFRNPMVSPEILGASTGAGFGAAVGILLSFGVVGTQISSFLVGLGAVMLTCAIATSIDRGNNAILVLVLTGIVISNLFTAFTSITKFVADPYSKLPAITFWIMGGLSSVKYKDIVVMLVPLSVSIFSLMLIRWKINILSFGEEEAQSIGVDTRKLRIVIIVCSTLLTATAVAIGGMVSWVGLIIPHIARLVVGPNYRVLLPASMLIGSTFLLLVDDVARSTFAMEIPLGIITSLIGAPLFIFLLVKGKKGWV